MPQVYSYLFFYSRPIRLSFEKETVENVRREYNRVKEEIANLLPYEFEDGVMVTVEAWATMLDGKALGYITGVTGLQNSRDKTSRHVTSR